MEPSLPPLAILLGVAGVVPFMVLGIGSLGASVQRDQVFVRLLIGYGACILSFLGGVHWGFALETTGTGLAQRPRLTLGVLPALIGWGALALAIWFPMPVLGLAALIAGFITTAVFETRAHQKALMPRGYMFLRWVMSVAVVAILTTVMVLRFAGAAILL